MRLAPFFSLLFTVLASAELRAEALDLGKLLKNGALRVEDRSGRPLMKHREDEPLIPASTMKVATAYCALEILGEGFRFKTKFKGIRSAGGGHTLYIEGAGDPYMVSEELQVVAEQLSNSIHIIDKIVIDTSLFESNIDIDGVSSSTNPYDARNAAFVGNFSSAMVTRSKSGKVYSAEPHTPITPLAASAGNRLPPGVTERINLGTDWRLGPLYGGELLAAFLRSNGVDGAMQVSLGKVGEGATLVYEHTSSKDLRELVRGLLQYSTNFTANQIFLYLGLREFGAPATVEKGQRAISQCLSSKVGWRGVHVEEGSGLSRKTKVTASQMNALLRKFEPYKDLLHNQDGFLAKTGTLTGVNTLVGYFNSTQHGEVRFSILVNSQVPAMYKYTVAKMVRSALK